MIYTGLLLGAAPGRALWESPLIPVLFAVSGLSAGMALTVVMAAVAPRDKAAVFHAAERVHKLDSYVIVLELAVVTALLGTVLATSFTGAGVCFSNCHGSIRIAFLGRLGNSGILDSSWFTDVFRFQEEKHHIGDSSIFIRCRISGFVLRFLIMSTGYSTPIPYVSNFFELVPNASPTLSEYLVTAGLFALLAVVYVIGSILLRFAGTKTTAYP